MLNAFTVDLEDWFHICGIKSLESVKNWSKFESRIENNTNILLNLLDEKRVKATFFTLGWVAKMYPSLLQNISSKGHEIASHSYFHRLIYNQSKSQFTKDLLLSKRIIEDTINQEIFGFRAPSFSITENESWVFRELRKHGFIYDSSLFPARRMNGGIKPSSNNKSEIHLIKTKYGDISEFVLVCLRFLNYV